MDEKERHEKGMARRRKVLGNAWVDRANAKKTAFNARIPGLHHPRRLGRNLDAAAFRRAHPPRAGDRHHDRARPVGRIPPACAARRCAKAASPPDDIKEVILQQAIYCGVPAANHAFKEAADNHRRARQGDVTTSAHPRVRFRPSYIGAQCCASAFHAGGGPAQRSQHAARKPAAQQRDGRAQPVARRATPAPRTLAAPVFSGTAPISGVNRAPSTAARVDRRSAALR